MEDVGGHGAGRGKIARGLKPQSKVRWKHDDINAMLIVVSESSI